MDGKLDKKLQAPHPLEMPHLLTFACPVNSHLRVTCSVFYYHVGTLVPQGVIADRPHGASLQGVPRPFGPTSTPALDAET